MFKIIKLNDKNDYMKNFSERAESGVYVARITSFGSGIMGFINKYMSFVHENGIFISGGIKNPDMKQIESYMSKAEKDFSENKDEIIKSLKKLLPNTDNKRYDTIAELMCDMTENLRKNGKSVGAVKNTYIKYMCRMTFEFNRLFNTAVSDRSVKTVFDGVPNNTELEFLHFMAKCGSDILIVAPGKENEYKLYDNSNLYSDEIISSSPMAVPKNFSLENMGKNQNIPSANNIQNNINNNSNIKIKISRPAEKNKTTPPPKKEFKYPFEKPDGEVCTNSWLISVDINSALIERSKRSGDKLKKCNVFLYTKGVWDGFYNDCLNLKLSLEGKKRDFIIEEDIIPPPFSDEIAAVKRKSYTDPRELICDLCAYIKSTPETEKYLRLSFYNILLENDMTLNKLTNRAITVLCWIMRYIPKLKGDSVFIYWGSARNENEALFLKVLANAGIDVIIITPNANAESVLKDKSLSEKVFDISGENKGFPKNPQDVSFSTGAYNASRDLDGILYSDDTGLYRTNQLISAAAVALKTTYDEIGILWNQENRYRPNFSSFGDNATLPVIFAKISGVPDSRSEYFSMMNKLTEHTVITGRLPYISQVDPNPIRQHAAEFYRNRKLQRRKIFASPDYKYGFIRKEMQEFILDKLDELIESEIIEGTHIRGTEYTVISTCLNLEKPVIQALQGYDFAKQAPKAVFISLDETMPSIEDAILVLFLHKLGFDVAVIVPTGYQSVEKYYTRDILINHNAGGFVYNMKMTDYSERKQFSFIDKLFRKDR